MLKNYNMEMDNSLEKLLQKKLQLNEFEDDEDMPVIVNESEGFISFD